MKFIIKLLILIYELFSVKTMTISRRPYFNRDNFKIYRRNVYITNFSSFPESLPIDNPNNSTSYIKFLWVMRNFNLTSSESREVNQKLYKVRSFV